MLNQPTNSIYELLSQEEIIIVLKVLSYDRKQVEQFLLADNDFYVKNYQEICDTIYRLLMKTELEEFNIDLLISRLKIYRNSIMPWGNKNAYNIYNEILNKIRKIKEGK